MNTFTLSQKAYKFFQWLTQIVFPASASLYFGLSKIYDWTNAENVVATLALLTTFFGIIMKVSSKNYYATGANFDGQIAITTTPGGKKTALLELDRDPNDIENLDSVSFKVTNAASPGYESP